MIGNLAPIGVTLGNKRITREAGAVEFRKDAVGGVQYVKLRLLRPLDQAAVSPFDTVTLTDDRNAETIATGAVADLGRGADASGPSWDVVAFGPAQHASDITLPLVYVTQSLDSCRQVNRMRRGADVSTGSNPGDLADDSQDGVVIQFPEGLTLTTNDTATMRFDGIRDAGMFLARVSLAYDGGSIDANYTLRIWTSVDGSGGSSSWSATLPTAASTAAVRVTTDFTNGRNVFDLMLDYGGGGGAVANDNKWASFYNIVARARLLNADGTDITAGASYTNDYVLAHEIVADLLGRALPEYDGANAYVDTAATHQIESLTYPDGVTPAQVLDDLLALEPAYRWWVTAAGQFRWEPWPTTVRYEHTLDDGAAMPASAQELFNQVLVRYRNKRGRILTRTRTLACPLLDDAGKVRQAVIDAGDEIATQNGADRLGDNFLADHNVPANAGTLTVARPIRDLTTGRLIEPHEIEPGELIRVRGIESYPDALNASSNDGLTVFRIWSVTYTSDSHSASLELDTYSRTTTNALRKLLTQRRRKR